MLPLSLYPSVETKGSILVTGKCHKLKVIVKEAQCSTVLRVADMSSVQHIADFFLSFTFSIFLSVEHIMGVNNMMNTPPPYAPLALSLSLPGKVAALNMLGKPTKIESVPFFWTVLLGKSIRYTGRVLAEKMSVLHWNVTVTFKVISSFHSLILGYGEGFTEIIYKGKVEERKFLAFYIK